MCTIYLLLDLMGYYIQLKQSIPKVDPLVVYLKFGKQGYKLMTNSGNNFMSDQLTENMIYSVVYGSNPLHFLAVDVLPPTSAKPQLA